jgi:hypothetical protein
VQANYSLVAATVMAPNSHNWRMCDSRGGRLSWRRIGDKQAKRRSGLPAVVSRAAAHKRLAPSIQPTHFAALKAVEANLEEFTLPLRIVLIGLALAALSIPAWAFDDSPGSIPPTNSPAGNVAPPQTPSCRKVGPQLTPEQRAQRRAIQAQRLAQLTPEQLAERQARLAERRAQRAAQGKRRTLPPCPPSG